MNGIGLLVLIAATAQVDSTLSSQAERDYGWAIDREDGALCYIVQISPEEAREMQSMRLENPSDMPEELVGRVTRIVVRIGTDVLPRTPSLAEISRRPRIQSAADISAALGPGRMSDLESGTVTNVQDPGMPRFPSQLTDGLEQSASDAISNLADRAHAAAEQYGGALQSRLGELSGGLPPAGGARDRGDGLGAGAAAGTGSALSGLPYPAAPGAGTNPQMANPPMANLPGTSPSSPPMPATAGSKFESAPPPDPTRAGTQWQPSTDLPASDYAQQPAGRGGYGNGAYANQTTDPRTGGVLSGIGIPNQQTPANGFGSTAGGMRSDPRWGGGQGSVQGDPRGRYPAQYTSGEYSSYGSAAGRPGYGGDPRGGTAASGMYVDADGIVRVAAATTGVNGGDPPVQVAGGTAGREAAKAPAVDTNSSSTDANAPKEARSGAPDGILQFFFVLSLLVNFYLGVLLRKLLSRYRSLLTSVRGQTA